MAESQALTKKSNFVALILFGWAFRDLLLLGREEAGFSQAVFSIGALPPPLVFGVALWLAWRTRASWAPDSSPLDSAIPHGRGSAVRLLLPGLGLVLAFGLFAWSHISGKTDLAYASAALVLVVFGALQAGWPGIRATGLPVSALLLGFAIPSPLEYELVWRLQVATAGGAEWLLSGLGHKIRRAGVTLRDGEHSFQVIESCSGLSGTMILLLLTLVIINLLELRRRNAFVLFLLTLPVSFAANVIRVSYIAASDNPEALAGPGGDHTLQGVAVLMGGSLLLYGIGLALDVHFGSESLPREETKNARSPLASFILPGIAAGFVLLSFLIPRGEFEPGAVDPIVFPKDRRGWKSEAAPAASYFTGAFQSKLHRRYRHASSGERPLEFIDVLIGRERREGPLRSRLFSSKRDAPGGDWNVLEFETKRLWDLGHDARIAVAAPATDLEHAIVASWILPHRNMWRASLERFLALDRHLPPDERDATLIRVIAYSRHGGDSAVGRAQTRLNEFLRDFQDGFEPFRPE